ncbi:mannitol-1-phosphate 5-dehydrogenase [Psychrobacillus glaciei]|uniref:Mannitol-1-phosphate 5-dehydrogenase n=1 Tax=Psychrobacillus glaciei TaxID=2283160 RepID=A0A5J6SJW1_9BACI|nr:mannitol-1-phosphate 5-dehydrogenase [Psychrobacillus glaciei]QFF97713.1 mannitol-1-phosphate 5-dehydrogenase [Psychrobacillus glaciei]
MNAVHFGAGNIGRGFIGCLLYESGYNTCFVDVNGEIVDLLNEKKEYTVQLANATNEVMLVKNVHAINSLRDPDLVVDAVANANLVTAAVGPNILPLIAGLLANGLKKRLMLSKEPLTIIACENMIGGSVFLKEKIYEQLNEQEKSLFDVHFSFPNAAVDRIVPNQTNDDKLAVTVEPFYEWIVDESEISGENPPINGVTFVKELQPFIERKLFTVNTGHAVVAYFGYLAGYRSMHEALADGQIKEMTESVLRETSKYLTTKYSFDEQAHYKYVQKIIARFANPFITDDTTRVGRSPMRKLKSNDRLVRPATQYAEMFEETPIYLAKGIASALHYDYLEDPEAQEIQEAIQQNGIAFAIETFTGIKADTVLFKTVYEQYKEMAKK